MNYGKPLLSTLVLLVQLLLPAATSADVASRQPRWLDVDGRQLPFVTEAELLEFLRTASIVETKQLSSGINRPEKLTLEQNGVRAHAVFRTVDKDHRYEAANLPSTLRHRRDSYIFEPAAYQLSRLLQLDRVPPAVLRTIDGQQGSVQLWVERARMEATRIAAGEKPVQPARWSRQQQLMSVFDNLIRNDDRNHGNMLLDESGKLWFIDHTRAFHHDPGLLAKIVVCERGLYERLAALDPDLVRDRLGPYLRSEELSALLMRRRAILKRIDRLIAERGEPGVLYELDAP